VRQFAKPGLPFSSAKRPHVAYSGVQGVSKPLQYTGKLFDMSASMLRNEAEGEEALSDADVLEAAMANEDTMVFAEFVNLMGGERIQEHIPGDWHMSAAAMRAYRNAYDTADVDGDNDVEFDGPLFLRRSKTTWCRRSEWTASRTRTGCATTTPCLPMQRQAAAGATTQMFIRKGFFSILMVTG